MEGREWWHHSAADETDRRVVRLVAGTVHSVAGVVPCGAGSVCALVRGRPDLPRKAHGELVPGLPHGAQRPGSDSRGEAGTPLVYPLSAERVERLSGGGDDAPGDDA